MNQNKTNRRKKNKRKNNNNTGWTVVAAKPRYKWMPVKIPPELMQDLTPFEKAVHDLLCKANAAITAGEMEKIINQEMNCSRADVGNVLYGRLKPFVEAENWEVRPRKWRIRKMKTQVQ